MAKEPWLKRVFGGKAMPPPAPDAPFYVIGDIHGCLPLLERLHAQLDADLPIVCVGDYVDRGDDSAGVLRWLMDHPAITCLAGNHEDMMLGFLDTPERKGRRWLRYGGLQTLASFGVAAIPETAGGDLLLQTRDALADAMGAPMIAWLRQLPTSHQSGNVAVVHAGADPALPIAMQSDATLMWGHPAFDSQKRRDGTWVVYGHVIQDAPLQKAGRIGIDTGAYATGRLTAAQLTPDGQITFHHT